MGFFGFVLWFFWYFILQTMRENYIFPLLLLVLWISQSHRASGTQPLQLQALVYKNWSYFSLISLHHLQVHNWQRNNPLTQGLSHSLLQSHTDMISSEPSCVTGDQQELHLPHWIVQVHFNNLSGSFGSQIQLPSSISYWFWLNYGKNSLRTEITLIVLLSYFFF